MSTFGLLNSSCSSYNSYESHHKYEPEHTMSNAERWARVDVERVLGELIVTLLKLTDTSQNDIRFDQPHYFAELGATSIDTLELFLAVEQKFGFQFDETELNPGLLITLDGFVDLICSKLQSHA